jgi:hypothetical protein
MSTSGAPYLAGPVVDQFADELRRCGEDVEDRPPAGVVVYSASCRLLKPTPCRRSVLTI